LSCIPQGDSPDRSLSPLIFYDLADSFILGQWDQDIRLVGPGIDDLRRLGIGRVEITLLLLGQANEHGALSLKARKPALNTPCFLTCSL